MTAPELVFSANANRPRPGVNVPVAAPSWPSGCTVPANCCMVRPPARGKSLSLGCSACGSSATAGGGAAELVAAALELLLWLEWLLALEPQPLRAGRPRKARSVIRAAALRARGRGVVARTRGG